MNKIDNKTLMINCLDYIVSRNIGLTYDPITDLYNYKGLNVIYFFLAHDNPGVMIYLDYDNGYSRTFSLINPDGIVVCLDFLYEKGPEVIIS